MAAAARAGKAGKGVARGKVKFPAKYRVEERVEDKAAAGDEVPIRDKGRARGNEKRLRMGRENKVAAG